MTLLHILAAGLLLATPTLARTDLSGCTSIQTMVTLRDEPGYGNTIASVLWYVPDTLEICDFVDCGGGRAPPKSVPGCPLYEGPETVTAQFLTRDPTAPSESAVQSEGAKETGAEGSESGSGSVVVTTSAEEAVQTTQQGAPATTEAEAAKTTEEGSENQTTSAPTTIMTTTSQAEDAAETSNSADEGAEESSTDAGSDEATTTGSDNPDETGAAGIVAVNMLGVAAAAFALF
ncbi:hypothetical protein CC79DRAFT_454855 [Sarocladium strictum]